MAGKHLVICCWFDMKYNLNNSLLNTKSFIIIHHINAGARLHSTLPLLLPICHQTDRQDQALTPD